MTDERLTEIAALCSFSLEKVREWCEGGSAAERQWLETASAREIAAWIVANAERLTRLSPPPSP
jgi:hypothetical protein